MERVHVTEYCSFKPLEFASYYCSDHTVIKGCKHLISIDIHVSIVLPLHPPPLRVFNAIKWETTDCLKSAFVAVDVSRLTRYQGRMLWCAAKYRWGGLTEDFEKACYMNGASIRMAATWKALCKNWRVCKNRLMARQLVSLLRNCLPERLRAWRADFDTWQGQWVFFSTE